MIKYLFASHGKLAEGVKNSLDLIMGPQKNIETFSAYINEDNDVAGALEKKLNSLSLKENVWIIVTDIFGGSVNNYLLTQLKEKHFYLVTGLSLPLALNLITKVGNQNSDPSLAIKNAIFDTQKQIIFCNELNNSSEESDSNDF